MNLIIITPSDMRSNDRCLLSDHRATHIREVLKATVGQQLRVGMLNGNVGFGEVISVDTERVELFCWFDTASPVLCPSVDLICAVSRPKTMRKVLFISGMLGVRKLVFVRANRTDKSYLSSPLLTPAGAVPHLLDGLAQGGLTQLPEVRLEPLFRPFVEDRLDDFFGSTPQDLRVIADCSSGITLSALSRDCDKSHIVVAIGPEGGWVEFERGLFERQRFVSVSLGPWTLRVEAAVIATLAQLHLAMGHTA